MSLRAGAYRLMATELSKYFPRKKPGGDILSGTDISVEPIDWDRHGEDLAKAVTGPDNSDLWTYVPLGPFDDIGGLKPVMSYVAEQRDWATYALVRKSDNVTTGTASYMRLRPEHGSAEVGCIVFGRAMQKTRGATEAMYLMARHIFEDLDYRRYEWKCHNGNDASKRAAMRFGFTFEGIFRNDMVMKGGNRDTAWFSMIDSDWPAIKAGYEAWLSPENFDESGRQLSELKIWP